MYNRYSPSRPHSIPLERGDVLAEPICCKALYQTARHPQGARRSGAAIHPIVPPLLLHVGSMGPIRSPRLLLLLLRHCLVAVWDSDAVHHWGAEFSAWKKEKALRGALNAFVAKPIELPFLLSSGLLLELGLDEPYYFKRSIGVRRFIPYMITCAIYLLHYFLG